MCVSVNLTVVYASVSYSIIKKIDLSGLLVGTYDRYRHSIVLILALDLYGPKLHECVVKGQDSTDLLHCLVCDSSPIL